MNTFATQGPPPVPIGFAAPFTAEIPFGLPMPEFTSVAGPVVAVLLTAAFAVAIVRLLRARWSLHRKPGIVAVVCAFGPAVGLLLATPVTSEARRAVRADGAVSRPLSDLERRRPLACMRQQAPRSTWDGPLQWGQVGHVSLEPEPSSCAPDGQSTLLAATHVTDVDELSAYAGVLLDDRVSRGDHRLVEVSFLIPEQTLPHFDHMAALVAWDRRDPLFRRVGAVVLPQDIAIEIEDKDCRDGSNLFAFAPLSSPLEADRWYRLQAVQQPFGGDSILTATVTDVASGEVLATTSEIMACTEPWHAASPMATGFLALTPHDAPNPGAFVFVDDFVALSQRDRQASRLAGRGLGDDVLLTRRDVR